MSESHYEKFFELMAKRSALIDLREDKQISLTEITPPIDWRELFGNENPVEIEIGCGKGRFLLEASRQHPEINYVGVERALKYVQHTKERLLKGNTRRVFLFWSDAAYLVNRYIGEGTVDAYHVYFPDPWPKKRHRKRRLFRNEVWLRGLIRTLNSSRGRIHVATDYAEYFYEIHDCLQHTPPLVYLPPGSLEIGNIPTSFEIKYRAEGRKIYRAVYQIDSTSSEAKT
ncbi:tRNA (guanosine(46)-N7)-methyltransferase TrmB [Candidatus Poribacteria bacterium]|nr:tRNA (guanosine(46)-N7)-methyltransferase TrmB [Candidatus Poribacteria bacterium]